MGKYFACLKDVIDASGLHVKPECIWNMDETGVQLDHRPGLIVAKRGSKYLHCRTSRNRETITCIGTINAAGDSLPPHVIVKGKTKRSLNSFKTEDAPTNTTWSWSDSGWTKQGIALLWFTEAFLVNIGEDRPQLLILDGHDSHNFVELIELRSRMAFTSLNCLLTHPTGCSHAIEPYSVHSKQHTEMSVILRHHYSQEVLCHDRHSVDC